MKKKLTAVTCLFAVFFTLTMFVCEGFGMSDSVHTALTKDEILSKLTYGMTPAEVKTAIGEPLMDIGSGMYIPVYVSSEGIPLTLYFNDSNHNLSGVYNSNRIDLLADNWIAQKASFEFVVNGTQVVSRNPIVTINENTYIPLKELETVLNIKVEWNEEGRVEVTTE